MNRNTPSSPLPRNILGVIGSAQSTIAEIRPLEAKRETLINFLAAARRAQQMLPDHLGHAGRIAHLEADIAAVRAEISAKVAAVESVFAQV